MEVFAVGTNGFIYHKWQTSPGGGAWSDWSMFDGNTFLSGAGVAKNADGRLELFGVSSVNHGMWHTWQVTPGGAWNQTSTSESWWYPLGGSFLTGVGAATNPDGRLEVFGIGSDNEMFHAYQSTAGGGSWSSWDDLGGWFYAGVGVGTNADGSLEVFGLGGGYAMFHVWQTTPGGAWSRNGSGDTNWSSLAGGFIGGAGVATNQDGRLEAFGIGFGGATYHDWQTTAGGGWSGGGWSSLGGVSSQNPSVAGATTNADGRLEVFVVGSDTHVYHDWSFPARPISMA